MRTWSWASIIGAIRFRYECLEEELLPKVLDAQVTYHGEELMGDVADAMLRVEGLVVPGRVFHGDQWERLFKSKRGGHLQGIVT